jgi:hypothetical protein
MPLCRKDRLANLVKMTAGYLDRGPVEARCVGPPLPTDL